MTKPIKKTLKNGLRIVVVPMKDNPTVTVQVFVGAGSNFETKDINGISHFLEHMCFKGTTKRPTARDISHELEELGCQYNAFTSNEVTSYYAKGDAKKFKKILDVVSDVYLNSTFPDGEVHKEKGVVIEEINMYEDMPNRHVQDLFECVLYGDQPAGWSVIGTKENIRKMTREDLLKYKQAHYVADSTVIVVAGHIENTTEVYKEIIKTFKNVHTGKKSQKTKTKISQSKPNVLLKYKKTDQTHFVLGFRSFPIADKRNTALAVLSGVLGAGMSSRLFIKLREEMGVAYYVRSANDPSSDHGAFQISAGVNIARCEEVIKEILRECKILAENTVSDRELNKVKAFMIGNMKMSLEATDDVANFYGAQEIMRKDMKTLNQKIKEVNAVTANDIKKLARQIFNEKSMNLALIGPYKDKSVFTKLLKF